MGGRGSGRHWHWNTKAETTDLLRLDVRQLAKRGSLQPGSGYSWTWSRDGEEIGKVRIGVGHDYITLTYRHKAGGSDWTSYDYQVALFSQPCNYGGHRHWFACPAQGCGRRVAVLYGGAIFACRNCHQLAYPSQREKPFQRYQRRAFKIRERLGWMTGPCDTWGERPKGMHRKNYERLLYELDHWESASDAAFAEAFMERFSDLVDDVPLP